MSRTNRKSSVSVEGVGGDFSAGGRWAEQVLSFLPKRPYASAAMPDALRPAFERRFPHARLHALADLLRSESPVDLIVLCEGRGGADDDTIKISRATARLSTGGIILHDRPAADGLPGAAADLLDRVLYDLDGESRLLEVRVRDHYRRAPVPAPTATVAAIVPNYNYGRFLREAIESLEEQTRPPDEVIIIDDASTDDSGDVLAELERRGYRVVRNAANLGIVENFRKAVGLTTADYVFLLGADNRLRPDFIEQCAAALDRDPDAAVAYPDMLLFGALSGKLAAKVNATSLGHAISENWEVFRWRLPDPTPEALAQFERHNFVGGSSMFRRAAYDAVGGYRQSDGPEDHNLFYRMWKDGGRPHHVDGCMVEYRQHSPAQANTVLGLALENRAVAEGLISGLARAIENSTVWPLIRMARSTGRRIIQIRQRAEGTGDDA